MFIYFELSKKENILNILITGISGFVGSNLSKRLKKLNHFIIGIDKIDFKNVNLIDVFYKIDLSIISPNEINQIEEDIDLVIHCAAAKGDYNISNDEFHNDNVNASTGIIKLLNLKKIKNVIHYSTVSVYGHNNLKTDEEAEKSPNSVYGKTKLISEELFLEWYNSEQDSNLTILRPSVIYGVNNYANMYNLMSFLNKKIVISIGKGNHIKSIISINNMVNITLFCLENKGLNIYNCIDKPYLKLKDIFKIFAEVDGFSIPVFNIPVYIAKIIVIPFDFFSYLLKRDLKLSIDRVNKFIAATDYRSEKLVSDGYKQKFETNSELRNTATWFLKNKRK